MIRVIAAAGMGAFALVLTLAVHAETEPQSLKQWRSDRAAFALALTEPITVCVQNHDTENPVFHGCIDWHSSVHGTWALTAYSWATGDRRYEPLIKSLLDPAALKLEHAHLAADPSFEMPYGRAWFLRLAIDYRRMFHDGRLDAFADDIAASLTARYEQTPPNPKSIAYQSATWALINLYDYGAMRGDGRILDFVRAKVRNYYLSKAPCPLQEVEIDTREFMAVCTNWAWLVSKVLPRDEFKAWLDVFLPDSLKLEPVVSPDSVHQSGLNFSRAWGLWNLYQTTGEQRFLNAYLAHFDATYRNPAQWKGDYGTVAHWVAQFGMLAIIESYYDDKKPTRP
jgi:hypothetical protein